ncbi:MAG TPA: electron transport complex subunit RsxC [Xanthomonadaceae bacterium]|nr:electron transport complex subunit RsxC [Xanthomonadaceae bacterium]
MRLHNFPGGLKLDPKKSVSTVRPLHVCPLPDEIVLPLAQHAGLAAEPVVAVGDEVLAGQLLARAAPGLSAPVHASTSGRIKAIEPRPVARAPFADETCIVIEPDGRDAWRRLPPIAHPLNAPAESLIERIHEAGVVGLGGAVFPTAEKISVPRELLIVNGAECEPYIACDDSLIRARPHSVIYGARIAARILDAKRIIIAVEDHMEVAYTALSRTLARELAESDRTPADPGTRPGSTLHFEEDAEGALERPIPVDLVKVHTRYPEGGERQLIKVLTGMEVPSGGLPRDIGVASINVGTAAAICAAVVHGEPLTSRVVTVSGAGIAEPRNFEVRLGTPIEHLVAAAGGYTDRAARLLLGGPMMGLALPHDRFPVTKSSNCVLALPADELRDHTAEMPCIRCMACVPVCPARLMPQELHRHIVARDWKATERIGLFDCIECGCCDLVCPSHIALVDWFRHAKAELRHRRDEDRRAVAARERFEARQQRLQRQHAEREARQQARKEQLASPEGVAEAIARARARKGQAT